jgi:hypothetical protein
MPANGEEKTLEFQILLEPFLTLGEICFYCLKMYQVAEVRELAPRLSIGAMLCFYHFFYSKLSVSPSKFPNFAWTYVP